MCLSVCICVIVVHIHVCSIYDTTHLTDMTLLFYFLLFVHFLMVLFFMYKLLLVTNVVYSTSGIAVCKNCVLYIYRLFVLYRMLQCF